MRIKPARQQFFTSFIHVFYFKQYFKVMNFRVSPSLLMEGCFWSTVLSCCQLKHNSAAPIEDCEDWRLPGGHTSVGHGTAHDVIPSDCQSFSCLAHTIKRMSFTYS